MSVTGLARTPDRLLLRGGCVIDTATLGGAAALGMADAIGSLRPGKRADIVVLRTDALNMAGLHDPAGAVVSAAHPGTGFTRNPLIRPVNPGYSQGRQQQDRVPRRPAPSPDTSTGRVTGGPTICLIAAARSASGPGGTSVSWNPRSR
jgi:Amidohydrolase family